MTYNIHYDVCAIIVHIFALFFVIYKKGTKKLQNKVYFIIIALGLTTTVFDIASAIHNEYLTKSTMLFGDFLNYMYLVTHNIMPILFCIYIVVISGSYLKKTIGFYIWLLLPTAVTTVLFILNPFTHGIFYYDENYVYTHGPHIYWLYASAIFYMLVCIFLIIKNSSTIMKNKKIALILMFASAMVSIGLQIVFPDLLVEMFVQGLAMLGVLFTIEDEDEILSSVMNVYSRKAFLMEGMVSINNNIPCTVVSIKFKNLKSYTELLGVIKINQVLKNVALWLDSIAKNSVYDCENGTFAIVFNNKKQKNKENLIEEIRNKLSEDWIYDDIRIPFVTHMSIIEVPKDADTIERLVAMVDTEYVCSDNERVTIIRDDRLHMFQRENMVTTAIQRALNNKTFKVYYQPIWDKVTGRIHSAEALLRLFDDELGFVPPDEFIPIAEKNGTIISIGEFVFEEVCRMFSEEKIEQYGIDFVELNLSTVQCMQNNLAQRFKEMLDKYNVKAKQINLEITESAAVNSPEMFINTMNELKEMGFTFSMDDYGTGYSNYSYMFDLDFDIIKLDKSILWGAEKNHKADIILKNSVRMIKEMGHDIVIEGVETEDQKRYVTNLGCDYCQGYYFSKPVDKETFITYCKEYNNIE